MGNGMGCGTVLFMIFLVLKLTGHISWSWWWVTAPLWVPITIYIVATFLIKLIDWVLETR